MDYNKNPSTNFTPVQSLNADQAQKEIEALRKAVEYHNHMYYVKNDPQISDAVFDKLFDRLQELEQAFPQLDSPDSPSRRVGAPPEDRLEKISHIRPMLSLTAASKEQEIRDFDEFIRRNTGEKEITYVAEPKFDGLSMEIVYRGGALDYGATRGNGITGENVTKNVRTIGMVPLQLRGTKNIPDLLSVRGEIYMTRDGFQALNKKRVETGQKPFANPRNAAAGIMRQLDSRNVADKPLAIVFYEIIEIRGREFESHWQVLNAFPEWGLPVFSQNRLCQTPEEITAFHREFTNKRDKLECETDGTVIKLDRLDLRINLGTRQRSPRWAIAWKFPSRKEETTLRDIAVQVGRTGILTPVALLEPVDVGGVTVSRATLHNEDEARKKDVIPGDRVRVERAGDVIPEVVERISGKEKNRKPFSMPKACPSCGSRVTREGAYHICPAGLSCNAQQIGQISHYASRDAMDIRGLGEKVIQQLVDQGLIKTIADLYSLTPQDLKILDGFEEKSAQNLYQAIQQTTRPDLDRFLYALGIRHTGTHVARILSREFRSLKTVQNADEHQLRQIPEIGPETAKAIRTFFSNKQNLTILNRLNKAGVQPHKNKDTAAQDALDGHVFVFTGELENYTRKDAIKIVEDHGGRAASGVSANTDYVVAGKDPGSKYRKARENNVRIINEKKFEDLLADAGIQ